MISSYYDEKVESDKIADKRKEKALKYNASNNEEAAENLINN